MPDSAPFRAALAEDRLILADGAMGTLLHARGADRQTCLDALNLQQQEWVLEIHRAYLAAGCDLIETNTFGATPFKLREHNLQDQLEATNAAGARLARQAAHESGRDPWIAGSIGPLGVRFAPYGRVSTAAASAAFRRPQNACYERHKFPVITSYL